MAASAIDVDLGHAKRPRFATGRAERMVKGILVDEANFAQIRAAGRMVGLTVEEVMDCARFRKRTEFRGYLASRGCVARGRWAIRNLRPIDCAEKIELSIWTTGVAICGLKLM
jgi:hypothetical protein